MDTNVTENVTPAAEAPAAAPAAAAAPQQRPFRPMRKKKKVCIFCADKVEYIDYKDTAKLKHFISERGKILPRRVSGACAKHQREVNTAIKRARQAALLPFITD